MTTAELVLDTFIKINGEKYTSLFMFEKQSITNTYLLNNKIKERIKRDYVDISGFFNIDENYIVLSYDTDEGNNTIHILLEKTNDEDFNTQDIIYIKDVIDNNIEDFIILKRDDIHRTEYEDLNIQLGVSFKDLIVDNYNSSSEEDDNIE